MAKKSSPNKALSIIVAIVLVAIIGFVMSQSSGGTSSTPATSGGTSSNIEVRDGVQYITIDVKGGYKPRTNLAKGGIPTKLIMRTSNTYDCSSSVIIPSINYRSMLPQTGDTVIDLGTPKSGDRIPGTCGMGMYNFSVQFN